VNIVLQSSLVLGVFIYFFILFGLIKRKSLDLKYTLLWIFSGLIMLFITIFPKVMINITKLLGIVDVTNGLFALVLFFVLIILISITGIVSKMKQRNKQLIQEYALLEKRVRELEKINYSNYYK
jgi:Uncharacterized conserved protein (DUF2304).